MGELLIRMVFSLAVVVGLLIVISRVAAKRFQGRAGSPIEVLHRQSLSKSASVSVVQVAGRVLVLGTTEQQVNVLTELDPTVLAEEGTWEETLADEALLEQDLDPATYGEPLTVPSLQALLAEPDMVTLEELFGHRPPATAAAPSFDTAPAPAYPAHPALTAIETAVETVPAGSEHDPVLPEDPSYAAFAAQLRAQLATGAFPEPEARGAHATPVVRGSHAAGSGRHAATAPVMELPPVVTGGARAARTAPAPTAPAPVVSAPVVPAPVVSGPTAADLAHLRAALLAAQVQAATPAPTPAAAPATGRTHEGALSGSVLSPSTWRQAFRAVNRRAS